MLKKIYYKIFSNFYYELEKATKGCKSLLDVGCGSNSPIKYFSKNIYSVGVDGFLPSIKKSEQLKIHNKYYKMDLLNIGKKFKENSFDCVIALDVIEHFERKKALKLIKIMEKIAKKKIILFTPNGFLYQGKYDNNDYQIHKSGWSLNEMKKMGYKVFGMSGYKGFRSEHAKIKYKPNFLWKIISDFSQIFVKNNPKYSFQLLGIKEKK